MYFKGPSIKCFMLQGKGGVLESLTVCDSSVKIICDVTHTFVFCHTHEG